MNAPQRQTRRPNTLLLLLFRLPVWIYRVRIGWLLGHRLLMITHRGRRTGKVRRTVLEVIRHDRATGEFIVVAGYGKTSDWYRNIRSTPALEIHVGRRRFKPIQRFLTPEEAYKEFEDHEARHPRMGRAFAGMIGLEYDGSEGQRRTFTAEIAMIALSPQ